MSMETNPRDIKDNEFNAEHRRKNMDRGDPNRYSNEKRK